MMYFVILILLLITDIKLASSIWDFATSHHTGSPQLYSFSYELPFLLTLLKLTFIKTIMIIINFMIVTKLPINKRDFIKFFLYQIIFIMCTTYLNVFLFSLCNSMSLIPKSGFITVILLAIIELIITIGGYIVMLVFLYGGIIIPFMITFSVILKEGEINLRLKKKEERRLQQELKSEAQLMLTRIDNQAMLDLIVDECCIDKSKNIPKVFSNEYRYVYDNNLVIRELNYSPILMTNDSKYEYYKCAIQKLHNEFKDTLGYNTFNVEDTHKFLLSFAKDIEIYLNTIDLSNKAVGIRKREQSFIHRQREYFIQYYLKQRLEMIIKDNYSIKLGYEGEQFVNKTLSIHHNLINLSNIRIEMDGRSIECDNIILSTKGIFILEVKNIGSSGKFKVIIEKDGRWLKKYESSQEIESMDSATSQNNAHVAFISRLLEEECTDIDFDFGLNGIVVISNNSVSIENNSMYQTILRADNVYNYISSQPTIYSKEQLERIKQALLKHNLDAKRYPVYQHVDELIYNIHQILNVLHKGEAILKNHAIEAESLYANYSSYL